MGQYYLICNLDKRQTLCPSVFGDGPKLMEFACSSDGVLLGLSVLTSNGNQQGKDLALPYNTFIDNYPNKYGSFTEAYAAGWRPRDRMPSPQFDIVGSWAGDRIVTAGDYGDYDKWITEADKQQVLERRNREYQALLDEGEEPGYALTNTVNLYDVADWFYEDVSAKVIEVLALCEAGPNKPPNWPEFTKRYLERCLVYDYGGSSPEVVSKKRKKSHVYDMTWIAPEVLDSMMRSLQDEPQNLVSFKKWLKQQKLSEYVKRLIPCYKPRVGREEKHNFAKIRELLREYGFIENRGQRPVLPPRMYIDAAYQLYEHILEKSKTREGSGINVPAGLFHHLAEILHDKVKQELAAATGRERVIDLQK